MSYSIVYAREMCTKSVYEHVRRYACDKYRSIKQKRNFVCDDIY